MIRSESIATGGLGAGEWQAIHQEIDLIFDELQARMHLERPDVQSRGERVQTARFQFNYRAFDPPPEAPELEPLVVGIRFDPQADRIHISGDICTEDSGRVLFDEHCDRETEVSAESVATVGRQIARLLASQTAVIADYFG